MKFSVMFLDFPIKKNSERVVGKPKLEKVQQKFVLKNTKENLTETFQTENLSQDDEKFKAANGHFDNECNDNQRKIQNKKIPDKENSTKDKLNPDALEQRTFDMKNFSNKHKEKNVPIGISHTDFNQKPKLEPLEIIENQKKVKKNSLKNVEKELPVLTFEQKTNEENQEFQNNPSAFKKDVLSGIGVKEKARHYEEKSIKVKQELKDKRHENGLVNQPNKLTTKPQSFANGGKRLNKIFLPVVGKKAEKIAFLKMLFQNRRILSKMMLLQEHLKFFLKKQVIHHPVLVVQLPHLQKVLRIRLFKPRI